MSENDNAYACVGVCMADPDSGYCLGCGRPPLDSPDTEIAPSAAPTRPDDNVAAGSTSPAQ